MADFDITAVRQQFPALALKDNGTQRVYLDAPAGTQVPQKLIDHMSHALVATNANLGGAFTTSIAAQKLVDDAHQAMAAFYNAASPREIIFGQSMTALTMLMARCLATRFKPGDEIIVCRTDHEGNISPWLLLAEDLGLTVKWLEFDPDSYEISDSALDELLSDKTRLVAIGYASNITGTINDVAKICQKARSAGALSYVDAVQYAPHGVIDVKAIGCDFLVSSSYKWFGPHLGVLWGREELLRDIDAYQVRPAANALPDRFELGTAPRESLAGILGALHYIASLAGHDAITRENLVAGMEHMAAYEQKLCAHLVDGLMAIKGVKIHGITSHNRMHWRVPTVSFTLAGHNPRAIAERLAKDNIFVWSGHNYAIELIEALGLSEAGGVVRVGPVHYNTIAELDRLLAIISQLAQK